MICAESKCKHRGRWTAWETTHRIINSENCITCIYTNCNMSNGRSICQQPDCRYSRMNTGSSVWRHIRQENRHLMHLPPVCHSDTIVKAKPIITRNTNNVSIKRLVSDNKFGKLTKLKVPNK